MNIQAIIWAAVALDTVLFSGILPILPEIGESADLGVQFLGILFGAYTLASLLTCLPFGLLSDRRSPLAVFVVSLGGLSAGALLVALFPGPGGIGLGRLVQGVAGAGVWTSGLVVAGLVAGVFSAATAGDILGPAISGFLYERASPTAFFWLAGVAGAVLTAAALRAKQRDRQENAIARDAPAPGPKFDLALPAWGLLSLMVVFMFSAILLTLPVKLSREFGRSPAEIGIILTLWSLTLFVTQLAAGRWSDRRAWTAPILTGLTLAGGGLLALAFKPALGYALLALVAVAVGEGIASTVSTSWFSKSWERRSPAGTGLGTSFGVVNTVWSLGFLLGSVIGGFVLAYAWLEGLLLLASAAFLLFAGMIAILWIRERKRPGVSPDLLSG